MKEYLITSGFLDRPRKLKLAEDYLEWEDRDLKGSEFTRLYKSEIVDFKHGRSSIVWYRFQVGKRYSIVFKNSESRELKIVFSSFFGSRKENEQKYADIVSDIWTLYHSKIVDEHLARYHSEGAIELQAIKVKEDGIELRGQTGSVPWEKVGVKDYSTYFSIFNKDNALIHSRVLYNEYGTETLWSVIRAILKSKGMGESGAGE